MRIYVAGPMSGYVALNFPAFHAAAARLRAMGWDVVNPAEVNPDPNARWADCMRADIRELMTCDEVALLPGWENSRGATLEHHIARALGMACTPLAEVVAAHHLAAPRPAPIAFPVNAGVHACITPEGEPAEKTAERGGGNCPSTREGAPAGCGTEQTAGI